MSQPPYGPPPGGQQPPYPPNFPPPQGPTADGAWPQGQLPYPPPGGWQQPVKPPFYKKPWVIVVGVLLAVGLIGSAINGGKKEDDSTTASATSSAAVGSTVAAPPTTQAVLPPPTTAAPTTQAAPTGVNFTMPDFVGMDLQSAQNLVQQNGVFLSRSHDLLGSRHQVVDSNWIVCDQNIPAGQQVTGDAEGVIDFGVVKREESCP
jgi:PASTA domain